MRASDMRATLANQVDREGLEGLFMAQFPAVHGFAGARCI